MSSDFMIESHIDTDPGRKRPNNEDAFAYFEPDQPEELAQSGRLYIVADGVGGAAKGEKASLYAAQKVLYEFFNDNTTDVGERLKRVMRQAGNDIYEHTQRSDVPVKMATTMVAASLRNGQLTVANVGDSRAYLIRNGQAEQITRDHTIAGEMLRNGEVDEAGAQQVKGKNKLTRSLGGEPDVHVDVFSSKLPPLRPGDRILLCSDGLARYTLSDDIARLASEGAPKDIVKRCIDFANDQGGADNITVAVIQVGEHVHDTTSVIKRGGEAPRKVDWDDAVTVPWIEPKRYGQRRPALSRQQQVMLGVLGTTVIAVFVISGIALLAWRGNSAAVVQKSPAAPESPIKTPIVSLELSSTPKPAPSATPPVSATATKTPTALPTLTAGDIISVVKHYPSDYQDFFVAQNQWESLDGKAQVSEGNLTITDTESTTSFRWSTNLSQTLPADYFLAEVTVTLRLCSGSDSYGLMIRVDPDPNKGTGYALEVSCQGSYRIRRFDAPSRTTELTHTAEGINITEPGGWTPSDVITNRIGAQNRIGLLARGNKLWAVINEKVLRSAIDDQYRSGCFALYVNAVEHSKASVSFDDFAIWKIPEDKKLGLN